MTFKQLRNALIKDGPFYIKWNRSGIIEYAEAEANGAVRVTNLISGRSFILPRKYAQFDITIVDWASFIRMGSLLEKGR
jgi:hypothetical protein